MRLKVLASGSKGNCYLLQGERETLILECGISYKEILKGINFDLSKVKFALCSHSHKDHSKSAGELMKNGIDVYMGDETAKELNLCGHRLKIIKELEQFSVGDYTILPFNLQHDVYILGFLIQYKEFFKLLFITDSYYCQYKFSGLQHIMIECNYSSGILQENIEQELIPISLRNRLVKSHFSLSNVKEFLKATDLKEVRDITLIHLSDGNSNAEQFKEEIEKLTGKPVYIAIKNLEICL